MERRSLSSRKVLVAFALTLALGMGIAIFVFRNFATYEPTALRHVPTDAEEVIRVNLEQGVLHEPATQYLLPLVERGRVGPEPRIKHLERKTTLELGTDVRELVFAQLDEARWLLVAAGLLRADGVLDGVARLLDDEHVGYARRGRALVHPSGIAFGVAPSGTVLLASDLATLESALSRDREPPWAAALRARGIAFAVRDFHVASAADEVSPLASGTATVSAEPYFPVRGRFGLNPGHWTADQVNESLAGSDVLLASVLPLRGFRVQALEGGRVVAQINLGRERFDAVVRRLAERLERALPSVPEPRK